jgi:hypothetical protein
MRGRNRRRFLPDTNRSGRRNRSVLLPHPLSQYRFLPGIEPYSCGVVAEPGWRMERVSLPEWLPWREGFEFVDAFLARRGLPRQALCAMELRSPAPFPMNGFIDFNRGYCDLLKAWGLLVNGQNPVARTNVVPLDAPPAEVVLHAFTVVRPSPTPHRPTFIVAGAGELRDARLEARGIVRSGDLSAEALREKCDYVLSVMEDRLRGLGVSWNEVTQTNVYTVHPLEESLRDRLRARLGASSRWGITWNVTRPPVIDIEFEMDLHGLTSDAPI